MTWDVGSSAFVFEVGMSIIFQSELIPYRLVS